MPALLASQADASKCLRGAACSTEWACRLGDERIAEIKARRRCAKLEGNKHSGRTVAMLDPKIFEELSARLGAIIAASPAAEIEKNARALLSSFFTKLDLVSREEFDIQAQVLLRTREKLKALEERVSRLETRAGSND
ncbi:accessory factor UbiK family protein [Propionivibrio sp.]|uniref:accessory factor UbiK family protein n=1 Tax=Propionivibrio sp. TaxID=2212460 RepID=UPI003BF30136